MTPYMKMTKTLKQAIRNDPRSLYRISKLAKLHYSVLQRFMQNKQLAIALTTVAALCDVVGLELRPVKAVR